MRTLNKITFVLAFFSLALSLTQQVRVSTVSAGVAITTWEHAPGDTCGASKIFAPGSAGIEADNGHIWTCVGSAWFDNNLTYVGVPSGLTAMVVAGSCPSGYTEVAALDAATPYGTLAAHGDVGGTGGANSITPTVATLTAAAQTFTGNSTAVPAPTITWPVGVPSFAGSAGSVPAPTISWPAGVPSFAGSAGSVPVATITWPAGVPAFSGTPFSSVINHTHTVTVTYQAQGGTTAATTGTHSMTSTATGGSARSLTSGDVVSATTANPSGGVASITPAGTVAWPAGVPTNSSVNFTPSGTIGWPAGVPTNSSVSFTPSGTIGWPAGVPTNNSVNLTPLGHTAASAVTGTLNSFDNRGAYMKVIFCTKA